MVQVHGVAAVKTTCLQAPWYLFLAAVLTTIAISGVTLCHEHGLVRSSGTTDDTLGGWSRHRFTHGRGSIPPAPLALRSGTIPMGMLKKRWEEMKKEREGEDGRREMTFYMYRAESDKDYPLESMDAADLAGVLWYLHNEVVVTTPRQNGITRILRFKVTIKNTMELYEKFHSQFGPFVTFNRGQCMLEACDRIWRNFGFVVGCQTLNASVGNYLSFNRTREPCLTSQQCNSPVVYSLPGSCPCHSYGEKNAACIAKMPGGSCGAVSGYRTCTFHVEAAGEIRVDELTGIQDYIEFIQGGGMEYDLLKDKGVGLTFWDGKYDKQKCAWRMDTLRMFFRNKYPNLPDMLPQPPCDFY